MGALGGGGALRHPGMLPGSLRAGKKLLFCRKEGLFGAQLKEWDEE